MSGLCNISIFLQWTFGNNHAEHIRHMPNEDVAMCMLAERCHAIDASDDRVRIGLDSEPAVDMKISIVQHYVKSVEEMHFIHNKIQAERN